MSNKELHEKYLKEGLERVVNLNVFSTYLKEYGSYEGVIKYLKQPKKTKENRKGVFKRKNTREIIDFAKLFSIEKAAREFKVSERTVYRYINNK